MTAFNEWGKLKEVWVGRPYPADLIEKINADPKVLGHLKKIVEETEEDMINFENMLKEFGCIVKRPVYRQNNDPMKKPHLMCPRDHVMKIGDNILIGPKFKEEIEDWAALTNEPVIKTEEFTAPSVFRLGTRIIFDAVTYSQEKFDYFKQFIDDRFKPELTRLSNRPFNYDQHTDGVMCVVKEGFLLVSDQAINIEENFPGWEYYRVERDKSQMEKFLKFKKNKKQTNILSKYYLDDKYQDKQLISFIDDYLDNWYGFSPETMFDVNSFQLDSQTIAVSRYNKDAFAEFKKLNFVL